jgi:hypothetical protein
MKQAAHSGSVSRTVPANRSERSGLLVSWTWSTFHSQDSWIFSLVLWLLAGCPGNHLGLQNRIDLIGLTHQLLILNLLFGDIRVKNGAETTISNRFGGVADVLETIRTPVPRAVSGDIDINRRSGDDYETTSEFLEHGYNHKTVSS